MPADEDRYLPLLLINLIDHPDWTVRSRAKSDGNRWTHCPLAGFRPSDADDDPVVKDYVSTEDFRGLVIPLFRVE